MHREPLFPDKMWNYKNFNMVTELDIAGDFIYDGIHTLNQMDVIDQNSMLFSFLYHVSVGFERLQKIIIVLFEEFTLDNYEEFEKSLITHSHIELLERICKSTDFKFNSRENEFLQLLSIFYKSFRYHRFNLESQYNKEERIVAEYIIKYLSVDRVQKHFITNKIVITDDVKDLFGKVVGSISKKCYELVHRGCQKNNTYTYELRSGSKAQKVFLSVHRKNSLREQKITEIIAFKELLVYLKNTNDSNSFLRFLQSIPPLDFDVALLNDYIYEFSKGIVSQELIDEVECLYEENSYSIERIEMVDVIGNPNIMFEFIDLDYCYQMLNDLISGSCDCNTFAEAFPQKVNLIDDEIFEGLDDVSELCAGFLDGNKSCEEFIREMLPYHAELEEFCKE